MYFSTKSVDTLRAIGKSPKTTSSSPPGRSLTAAKRQFLPILTTRRVGAAMWAFFVVLSGVMVWHNLCIRSWGIGTFPSFARNLTQREEYAAGSASPVIDADGKPSFLRYARTPVGRMMHILPAGLWSAIGPLQLWPSFRLKHRTAHRRMGRFFIAMSVSISIGVVPIITSGATILYQVFTKVMMLILTACFLGAGLLSVHHARNKRMAQHRVWILRHLAMGYSVHLLRVLGPLTFDVLPTLIPGYTDHTPEGFRLRSIVFGTCGMFCLLSGIMTSFVRMDFLVSVILSVGSVELWLHHTSPSKAASHAETKKKTT